jgi:hypothetical protein
MQVEKLKIMAMQDKYENQHNFSQETSRVTSKHVSKQVSRAGGRRKKIIKIHDLPY